MNLTDNETLKFLCGAPVFLEDICAVYPATLREIVTEGYDNFQRYLGILTMEKPVAKVGGDAEFRKLLEEISDFQYILMLAATDLEVNTLIKKAFLFFTHEEVNFSLTPAQIVVGPMEEKHIIDEAVYYELQRLLRRMYFIEQEGDEIVINANDDPMTKRLKQQMRANREKVRKAKAKQAEREKNDLKFSDLIGSVTINNCGLNMENVWDITYYAFHDQLKRMGWRDQFNINHQAAMAGAKLKKSQLKHWMRSIANSEKS